MPVTIEVDIKEVLDKLTDKLEKLDAKIDAKLDKIDSKIDKLEAEVSEIKVAVAAQGGKLDGIDKRLGSVEFSVRLILGSLVLGVVGSALLAVLVWAAKSLGFVGSA